MKGVAKVIGWLLVLGGVVGIGVIVWAFATDRMPGNFVATLLFCAPVVLVMVFGGYLIRAGNRQPAASSAPVWTRRGPV